MYAKYIFFALLMIFCVPSIGKSGSQIDIKINDLISSENSTIVSLPIGDIKSLPLDSVVTDMGTDKPARIWYGAPLKNVLEELAGVSLDNVRKISISAPDGYSSVIYDDLLPGMRNGLFAFRLKGEDIWPEKYGSCRLVFPSLRTMYWVNNPHEIIIDIGRRIRTTKFIRLFFLHRSKWNETVKTDYNGKKYVAVMSLLAETGHPNNHFRVISMDGLFREYAENDLNNRFVLKMQPDSTWNLTGIDVPGGLKTRNVFAMSTENNVIFLKKLTGNEAKLWTELFLPEDLKTVELNFALKSPGNSSPSMTERMTVDRNDMYRKIEWEMEMNTQMDHALLYW
jgi:hypothetical protein